MLRIIKKKFNSDIKVIQKRYFLGTSKSKTEISQDNDIAENSSNDEVEKLQIEKPEINCNKSRLLDADRNRLHNRRPYKEPQSWIHLTEKYQRKMFALYGFESGIDPRICFYTKSDLEARKRYEEVAEPYKLQYMIDKAKEEEEQRKSTIRKREDDVAKKMEKLEQWKADLRAKIAKKEADAIAAKERKDRLVEEVRRHFGYKMDPRDDRFKEVLEQKEKEERKKLKEMKRQAKEQKVINKLLETSGQQ